jgi:tetratricopeptide repeat protein 21B
MAKVHKGVGNLDGFVAAQKKALELQVALVVQLRGELPTLVEAQRQKAAEICYELAVHYSNARRTNEVCLTQLKCVLAAAYASISS